MTKIMQFSKWVWYPLCRGRQFMDWEVQCLTNSGTLFLKDFGQAGSSCIVVSWLTEKAVAPHSSTLACKIPWTEEPGRLQSVGSLRVGHNWVTSLLLFPFLHWKRKWQPTPVFLPGESQGQRSLVGCRLWGHTVGLKRLSSSSRLT